jgi:hypothetical protein
MCYQTMYQHQCAHTAYGGLTTCGTPSAGGHLTHRILLNHPGPCYVCSTRLFPVSHQALNSYRAPALIAGPVSLPCASNIPSIAIASLPPTYSQPPRYSQLYPQTYSPQPFFQAGNVPAWIPREIRYENIRGAWVPVEHFRAADIGMDRIHGWNPNHGYDTGFSGAASGNCGWNPVHGYDTGAPPPGVGNPSQGLLPYFSNNAAIVAQIHQSHAPSTTPRNLEPVSEEPQQSREPVQEGNLAASGGASRAEPASYPSPSSDLVSQSGSNASSSTAQATQGSEGPVNDSGNGEGSASSNPKPSKDKKVRYADNVVGRE